MGKYVAVGMLLEFVDLGVGMVLEIRASREPVVDEAWVKPERLCKGSYVIDVLVGDETHEVNLSVHWYHPDGDPQGWWRYPEDDPRHRKKHGWYGVNWLN